MAPSQKNIVRGNLLTKSKDLAVQIGEMYANKCCSYSGINVADLQFNQKVKIPQI